MTNQRSTNQRKPDARNGALDAVSLFGAGSRIPSGPAVSAPQRKGRTHDRSRSVCQITQKNSCIQRAVHTCERSEAISRRQVSYWCLTPILHSRCLTPILFYWPGPLQGTADEIGRGNRNYWRNILFG